MNAEERLQQECFEWFWNRFPEYRGLLCYNLNNSKDQMQGARNKRLGLIPGRSDMVLYFQGTAHMIEMKTAIGRQSSDQIQWMDLVTKQGFIYYVVRDLNAFKAIIGEIIGATTCKNCNDLVASTEPTESGWITVCPTCGEYWED